MKKADVQSLFNGNCNGQRMIRFYTDNNVSSPIATCLGMAYSHA